MYSILNIAKIGVGNTIFEQAIALLLLVSIPIECDRSFFWLLHLKQQTLSTLIITVNDNFLSSAANKF
ncbi:hypothetical protein [Nostoc sp. TCL26-01]|uniref:hypothetical protein n=1 Tax=Nostoc sp. TCL26-01 TaxID=2576904 RepID=UPI0015B79CA2